MIFLLQIYYLFIHCLIPELMLLRNNQSKMVEAELKLLYQESLTQTDKRSILSVLRDPTLLLPVILVCSLCFGQQMSGINAVSEII